MYRKSRFLVLLLITVFFTGELAAEQWLTDYELSGYLRTPDYSETISFCERLAAASEKVSFATFGTSPQGRALPLLIADHDGLFTPEAVHRAGRVVMLVQAGIHAGEIGGKDAGLMLIRDLVTGSDPEVVPRGVTLLFIPIFNVDGHERRSPYNRINQNGPEEMGWRTTAQNLNLNRDFLKADAPEMQAWLRLFNRWLPDLLVDCHTTDGADYQYPLTYGMERFSHVAAPLRRFCLNTVEPFLNRRMAGDGFPMHPYVMFRNWSDIRSGLRTGSASPRYSTGYGAVQNRLFFLIETHMLKPYRTRVEATRHLLRHLLALAGENAEELKKINRESDRLTAEELPGKMLPLDLTYSRTDSIWEDFAGVEYERIPSEISGTDRVVYHPDRPTTFRLPFFNKTEVIDSVRVPHAYLIPAAWEEQIRRLSLHGIKIHRLLRDTVITVESYRFANPRWAARPFEGRHRLECDVIPLREERSYPAGTVVVLLNQRTNRVAVHLLEPKAPDSFISWGFWDAIFEQKEYAEGYVLEKLARQMLHENPELKEEFEARLAADSAFASSPRQRLYFFYTRSPYWDSQKDLYPVGRLMQPASLPLIEWETGSLKKSGDKR